MKIIDLLNKIANGEEVPKKIKYEKHIYEYEEGTYDWSYYVQNNGTIKFLLTDIFNSDDNTLNILNDEVEILEEKKKIPEKLDIRQEKNIKNNWKWKVYGKEHSYNISTPQKIIADKLNEVIDYLKSKGE